MGSGTQRSAAPPFRELTTSWPTALAQVSILAECKISCAGKVPFVVTAFGLDVDPFMLHIYAAVAQKERALISERTKGALRGRVLSGESLRKLTLESEKKIYEAYMNRVSPSSLAKTYGVSRQTVYEAINRYKAVRLGQ